MDATEMYFRGATGLRPLIAGLGDDHWELPTPCEAWTVRNLTNHLVGNAHYLDKVFARVPLEEAAAEFMEPDHAEYSKRTPKDVIGDDATAVLDAGLELLRARLDEPGVLDQVVEAGMGTLPAAIVLAGNATEWVVHGWDLSRAIGAELPIDADVVEAAADLYEQFGLPEEGNPEVGLGPRRAEIPDGADPLTRLVIMAGRVP